MQEAKARIWQEDWLFYGLTTRPPTGGRAEDRNTLILGVWTDKGSKIFKIVNKLRAGVVCGDR